MRISTALLGLTAGVFAGAAAAQPVTESPPSTAVICVDVAGRTLPVRCRAQASRVNQSYDICQCLSGGQRVIASVCPDGVSPPGDSAALEQARRAAIQHGSIVGATFRGQPMCVAPRQSRAGG
ncbi:MAG TPA: hypothetical protein VLI41_01600 [Phenylobacterium sp.]|uniref:hypothetical protein n=1 Tax=Phenylobacterium sp. TaxID=1871053 RepID=UPI002C989C79|nr:hypothetical protein [Phenylobacterium sp.]HSV01874.1 hypothetical protein [Phenylobacterium sp.]